MSGGIAGIENIP